jgi:hypothetical protein
LGVAVIDIDTAPYGVLLLRLCLAAIFIAHVCASGARVARPGIVGLRALMTPMYS